MCWCSWLAWRDHPRGFRDALPAAQPASFPLLRLRIYRLSLSVGLRRYPGHLSQTYEDNYGRKKRTCRRVDLKGLCDHVGLLACVELGCDGRILVKMSGQAKTWRDMRAPARLFLASAIAAGLAVLVYSGLHWSSPQPTRLICYLGLAVVASQLKVKLPGFNGTMSASFVVILIAVTQLSPAETLAVGCTTILAQAVFADHFQVVKVLFNVCATAVAVVVTEAVYRAVIALGHSSGPALALFAVACAYFVANTFPVAAIISLTEDKQLLRTWRECYFWAFPYYFLGAGLAGILGWLIGKISWEVSLLLLPAIYLIYRSYGLYLGKLEAEKLYAEQMAKLHVRTIEVLALAIEAKDQTTHDHLQRVRIYAREVAKELKVTSEEQEALEAAALLHDIGKLAVPEHIVSKPGKLTPQEFEKMKIHPVVGAELLEKVEFPYPVVPIVRAHHEKWDGSGYPYGLKGDAIPIGARILAAVDFLDALTSDRQYRRALTLAEAIDRLSSESGKSFDPKVVTVLLGRYKQLEKLVEKETSRTPSSKLSTDLRIERGAAPASGFEKSSGRREPGVSEATFLDLIAAAKQEAQTLFELSQEVGTSLNLDDTLSVFASKLRRLVSYDSIVIYVKVDEELHPQHVSGENFRLFSSLRIPIGEGVSGWAAHNKTHIINGNPAVEPGYLHDPGNSATLASALSVPLEGLEGVVGVVSLYRIEKDAFSNDDLRVLLAVSSKMALAIENALRFQQAEDSATTDYLTGLPNARSMFLQLGRELARAKRTNSGLTVMVCDLDGFKQVNDRFGHLEGNRVLQLFAKGVKQACRDYDYVARLGGDEFVLIVPELSAEAAKAKTTQLRQLAEQAGLEVCGEDLLSVSVGIAIYPQDGEDIDRLLAESDRRMYGEKQYRSGKKNRRRYPRLACCVAVEVHVEESQTLIVGKASNMSAGGCYIETGTFLPVTAKLELNFSTDTNGLLAAGTVVRSNPGEGIAVKFCDASTEERNKIKEILDFVERTLAPGRIAQEYLGRLTNIEG